MPIFRLYEDRKRLSELLTVTIVTPTSNIVDLGVVLFSQLDEVYECVYGIPVLREDYRGRSTSILFETMPVNDLILVPVSNLSLTQIGLRPSIPKLVYLKQMNTLTTFNKVITSYDFTTDSVGPYTFSFHPKGPFYSSLDLSEDADSFYVRSELKQPTLLRYVAIKLSYEVA